MKLKELKRTVNVCWSPAEVHPVALAAGAAAHHVDASFSSSSYLELYSLNLEDPGQDLELKSSLQTDHKFQKLVWSGANVIVGGCDGGLLQFYSVDKLLSGASDALQGSNTKHTGDVSALDINPYQKNLLASGAAESEIFIWDLNNTAQPMAPGNRSQPYDHVQGLAWNQQVQHILGSTFSSRCVVWDLRKNEPIMKLSDSGTRSRWRSLAWHPAVATQLCVASEEDQAPVVQLWDLRLAAAPLVTLEGHHKGVMALSWSRQDPDMLLSAGKDGRVLCWNPNDTRPGGCLLGPLAEVGLCLSDVAWSPRVPALLAATGTDQLALYSLSGGSKPDASPQSQSNIMDSFGGADSFSQLPAVPRAAAPAAAPAQLPHAPAWLKRPAAANFAFGGKLVTFGRCPQEGAQRQVYVSQVVSEPEIVEKAAELDDVLSAALSRDKDAPARLAEYCLQRGDACAVQSERYMWFFLRASFLPDFKHEALNLLGFKQDDIPSKFKSQATASGDVAPEATGLSRGESTETEAELSTDTSTDLSDVQTLIERKLSNIELSLSVSDVVIPEGEDSSSAICRALVCNQLEEAVELCLEAKRVADALVIASLGSPELVSKVARYHLASSTQDPVALLARSMLAGRWETLVQGAAPSSWRHVLATVLAHADPSVAPYYCEMLGDRLSQESEPALVEAATTCYLVGQSSEQLVSRWNRTRTVDPDSLATVTTLALLARRAAELRGRQIQSGGQTERAVCEWAARLAAQGCLQSALRSLQGAPHGDLRDRLEHALGLSHTDKRQTQPAVATGRARAGSAHAHRAHAPHNDLHNSYGNAPQTYDQQWGQSSVAAPSYPPRGFPQSTAPPQPQPLQPQLQPAQTASQPPRPPSVGSQSGGITSRSKYKVDPSVQAAPLYNQYSFNNPPPAPAQSYGYNSPVPDQYNGSFAPINPALNPGQSLMNPGLNQMPPGQSIMNPGLNPMNPGQNLMNPAPNAMNPSMNGGYYASAAEPLPAMPAATAAPGWNDPPMLSSKPKMEVHSDSDGRYPGTEEMSARHAGTRRWGLAILARGHQPKQEIVSQAPITHPLFGTCEPQHVPLNPPQFPAQTGQFPGQIGQFPGQTAQFPGQTGQFSGQTGQYPGQEYPGHYDQYGQYQNAGPGYTQQVVEPAAPAAPPTPAPKAPLSEELAALAAIFDGTRAQCSERAANPQMKRKLDDIQKRLETLYDLLREHKLSESAVQTLAACGAHMQARDYGAALAAVTSLATGADFAAAAAFLPGLKGLLQHAHQLQV